MLGNGRCKRSECFHKRSKLGQANIQKHKSEHERAPSDNEEPKGIKTEECFSIDSPSPCPLHFLYLPCLEVKEKNHDYFRVRHSHAKWMVLPFTSLSFLTFKMEQ